MKMKRETERIASERIQRCWTGYKGRKQFWNELRKHRVSEREEHLQNTRWVIRHEFERKGALLRVQRWWRNHLARKYMIKRMMTTLKINMAIIIQSFWRSILYGKYISKRKVKRLWNKTEKNNNNKKKKKDKEKEKNRNNKKKKQKKKKKDNENDDDDDDDDKKEKEEYCNVTIGKYHKILQWTCESIIEKQIKKGIFMYLQNKEKKQRQMQSTLDGSSEGAPLSSTQSLMVKLGLAGSVDTKLRLKKWRRRADVTIKEKHHRLNQLRHPLERRLLVYPFDIPTLRACGKRDLYERTEGEEREEGEERWARQGTAEQSERTEKRMKRSLRRLIRAMWSGYHLETSQVIMKVCQSYFHTKRNGNTEMRKLMQRKDVSLDSTLFNNNNKNNGGVDDVTFWKMLGETSYNV
jgi:hypothetical protein